ncbi:M-phase phosphoprotein 8 [Entomophthora muscae]|uniref:M-phase phosphoprotein 8 n=1 Tax=Entomophthora muscae TaxID=34485 RepID=A0ACC2TV71_9FUNG|nr:M-phase phosphoprotein 8 [Entomophthora muscae]
MISPPPIQTGRTEEYEVEYIHCNQTHYQKPQYYVKWKGYLLEESTWEPVSNLTNAQEAVKLYLNKKNWKRGPSGEEGDGIRIDNSFSLETQAQEQESNPEPGFLWAAGPVDCRTTCLHFSGIEPPQADTKCIDTCSKKSQTKEIIAPNGGLITAPNEGTDLETISFSNSKSTPATNQEPTQERGTGLQPSPMTSTLKQGNQAAKLRFLTNERTPGPSAICRLWTQAPSSPGPGLPNTLMNPHGKC